MFFKISSTIINVDLIISVHEIGGGVAVKMSDGEVYKFGCTSFVEFHEKMKLHCSIASF